MLLILDQNDKCPFEIRHELSRMEALLVANLTKLLILIHRLRIPFLFLPLEFPPSLVDLEQIFGTVNG
jgi:hypothetical protein